MRTVLGNERSDQGDGPDHWNVVQNNGLSFLILDFLSSNFIPRFDFLAAED